MIIHKIIFLIDFINLDSKTKKHTVLIEEVNK